MTNIVHYLLEKNKYSWEETFLSIKRKENIDWDVMSKLNENSCELSLMIDQNNYPEKFKDIYMPPFEIFYCGDYRLIDSKKVIGVAGNLNKYEVNNLVDFVKKQKLAIAIIEKDLSLYLYERCKVENLVLIVICKNKIDNFNYYNDQYSNLLLLSETYSTDWNRSEEQTYERILFAVSNIFLLKTNNMYKLISLHLNNKFVNKKFYVFENFKLKSEVNSVFDRTELISINSYDDIHHM